MGIVDSKVEMFCSDFGDTLSSTHWTDASLTASQQQDGNIFFFLNVVSRKWIRNVTSGSIKDQAALLHL